MNGVSCQPLLDRLTFALVKTGVISDLSKRKTELEKIKFCLGVEVTYSDVKINVQEEIQNLLDALYDKCEDHSKSEALAMKAKNQGSKAYLKKKDKEALNCFSESICLAPAESSVLPLALANRSAVLYQMRRYKEALQDMEWAEGACYPAALRHKLLVRRCRCYLSMGDIKKAREVLEACNNHIHLVPLEAKDKYEMEVADLKQKIENHVPTSSTITSQENLQQPSLYGGENETVKYITNAFEMKENDKYGRHIVAVEEVSKGSEVFVEKPYAAILLPEHHKTHCHSCFSRLLTSFPCSGCRDAIFCNEECRRASRLWHQYECGILHILSSVGIAHLALRILLITGWKLHCYIREEVVEGKVAGFGEKGVYNGPDLIDRYRAVFHLLPHFNSCLLEDQLQYCLAAILLATAISDKTNFIKENMDENGEKTDLDVPHLASAVMRHIAQLVSNAHAITQLMPSDSGGHSRVEQIKQIRVASAIYPTASMMNHSCKPNIINSFYKDVLVIRTTEDIKPGDQVSNCYGPHYCRQTREERQEALKQQYFFTCKCEPCTQPKYMKSEASWSGFYCENCGGASSWMGNEDPGGCNTENNEGVLLCLQCHRVQRPSAHLVYTCSRVNSLHESGEEAIRKGNLPDAVSLLRNAIQIGSKVYLPENQYFLRVRDTLARALADSGDYENCTLELQECLQFMEQRYGPESIELAHEFLKYSEVLELAAAVNDKLQDELRMVKKRINDIFTLNYGPQWKIYLSTCAVK
ncbi:hypothetical protein O3P69_007991 [Scylla paramamosain]|uniref:Protein-lysine N-methyltransferase SMYD4 n=1 Tax=Scylla paramamosain TaxID=85552 RepID=A0AAW0SZK0_SCYPA